MRYFNTPILFLALLFLCLKFANGQEKSELIPNLKLHIEYLASDKLEGRATGSEGERLAAQYISAQFEKIGLDPYGGDEMYLQRFEYTAGKKLGPNNHLTINSRTFLRGPDSLFENTFFPLSYSGNGTVQGEVVNVGFGVSAPKLNHDDYKGLKDLEGKIFLIELSGPEGNNPHSDFAMFNDINSKILLALEKGAKGILFINTEEGVDDPNGNLDKNISASSVPIIFMKSKDIDQIKKSGNLKATMSTELIKIKNIGTNVIGFLDNKAATTIIFGAHYDHLGYGTSSSLYRGDSAVHNGADDNASGVAAIIEIANHYNRSKNMHNNFLFIAFSGEELGLYGSNYYAKNPTVDLANINLMVNLDMVGRLDTSKNTLGINGVGTSPHFKDILSSIQIDSLKIKTSESGIGPSDQTSFYLQDIPVLHFFSGIHSDYHKPSDDYDKINYEGEETIIEFILIAIDSLDKLGRLEFIKTKDQEGGKAPKFTVALGVIPDYLFDGEGMRIDGVSEGKPASKAGLLKGDVVLGLGQFIVKDMMSYMVALSKFKKGDSTIVTVYRNKEVVTFDLTF